MNAYLLMNNKLDIDLFFNFKYNEDCLHLDNTIIESFTDTFINNKNKKIKVNQKKTLAVIKNPKLRQIKDKIMNKVNLILNKLSENNIDNLVIEFIENVKINNINDYNEFIRSFYIKLLSEIGFFKFYIKFFYILTTIYENVNGYKIKYFYDLIESKFNYDYFDKITTEIEFLKDVDNEKRINNLILIYELSKMNYFNNSFNDFITDNILKQKKYLCDIYHWLKNSTLTQSIIECINIILSEKIQLRDKVLLDSLLNNTNNIENPPIVNKIIFKSPSNDNKLSFSEIVISNGKNTTSIIELDNNLEEYFFINNSESIEDYINNNCVDANTKNKFCEYIMDKYFKLQQNESQKLFTLIGKLIKSKLLFKSNLSRGLLNLYNNKTSYNQEKFKKLLLFLKSLSITNGLETLMAKYKIDINS